MKELIHTCFSKFRYHNSSEELCKHLKEFLPYCESVLAEEKADLEAPSEPAIVEVSESDKSVLDLVQITLKRDQEYAKKLKTIARNTNCLN